jgi:hypothetical protein
VNNTEIFNKNILLPEEISPVETKRIIDFLNKARTPEEVAAAINLTGQRDMGIKVARNIIKTRDSMGGFRNLMEVASVPRVGKDRFARIVNALRDRNVNVN